jgi:hypothetical protein
MHTNSHRSSPKLVLQLQLFVRENKQTKQSQHSCHGGRMGCAKPCSCRVAKHNRWDVLWILTGWGAKNYLIEVTVMKPIAAAAAGPHRHRTNTDAWTGGGNNRRCGSHGMLRPKCAEANVEGSHGLLKPLPPHHSRCVAATTNVCRCSRMAASRVTNSQSQATTATSSKVHCLCRATKKMRMVEGQRQNEKSIPAGWYRYRC